VQKEIIIIIGGQEQVKVLSIGLIAKGFCYPEISRSNLEAKNKVSSNYFENPVIQ
jgi:hypothetical protein